MDRITRKDAEGAMSRLAAKLGRPFYTDPPFPAIDDPAREGALFLEAGPGGYSIRELIASSPRKGERQTYTAESEPFGSTRRSAAEIVTLCRFASDALFMYEERS